jgi:hypothetical protein
MKLGSHYQRVSLNWSFTNKNIIKEIIIFSLIVNFYCASRSVNLKGKAPFQMSKQAGLSIRNFDDGRKNG